MRLDNSWRTRNKASIATPNIRVRKIELLTKTGDSLFEITFWGTRGTLATPGQQFSQAGGNTNCTEVTCGKTKLIFDAGTGIRELGSKLASRGEIDNLHIMLTHAHYDHVEGIPFFAPFFNPDSKIQVYCGKLDGSNSTKDTVLNLMRRPYFPVGPDVFTCGTQYNDLKAGDRFEINNEVKISTTPLVHPGGATAYRIDYQNKSFAVITDTEHIPGQHDQEILKLIDGVDLFIYDSSLTDDEVLEFAGYGHSSYEEGMRLCKKAGAKAFMAFHHMPFRTDRELNQFEQKIREDNPASGIAREGMTLTI